MRGFYFIFGVLGVFWVKNPKNPEKPKKNPKRRKGRGWRVASSCEFWGEELVAWQSVAFLFLVAVCNDVKFSVLIGLCSVCEWENGRV